MAQDPNTRRLNFRLEGQEDLVKKFHALNDVVKSIKIRTALRAGGLVIMNDAKQRAPVLTGNLRRSITMEDGPGEFEINIGTDVEYAPFQEFGTSRMGARPFLRPAFDENTAQVEREIAEALWDIIEGVVS
jgi:HK97 gp10 family phage protein